MKGAGMNRSGGNLRIHRRFDKGWRGARIRRQGGTLLFRLPARFVCPLHLSGPAFPGTGLSARHFWPPFSRRSFFVTLTIK